MKRIFLMILILVVVFAAGWYANELFGQKKNTNENIFPSLNLIKKYPLEKYSIEKLTETEIEIGVIDLGEKFEEDECISYLFNFRFKPDFENYKNVSGQINLPVQKEGLKFTHPYPIIAMVRGYVSQDSYKTGDGTRNAAAYFCRNGFATIAPDFLGYGNSDTEAGNIFETRFQTYVTFLTLLASLDQLTNLDIDPAKVGIWAHSNGGQITLTALEVTGSDKYPTVLWAPVSKPFPYSVLYYTDESIDGGKLIRRELSKFEEDYDTDKYSLTNYFDRINSPILLQQGSADDAVPTNWSYSLYNSLDKLEKEIDYKVYEGADHNMKPFWNQAIQDDLVFFNAYFTIEP